MKYYTAIQINDFMKFAGKWMELENIIPSEVIQTQKSTHGIYIFLDKWILAQKLKNHMELTKRTKYRCFNPS
jgi:hypothetical protein